MKKLFKMLLVVALVFGFMSCNNDVSETTTLNTIEQQLLILGRVTDANRTSVGVSGVQVTLAGGLTRGDYAGTETVTTDANGFYVFDAAVSEDSDFMIYVEDTSGTYISYKSTIENSDTDYGVTAENAYTLLYGADYLDVATTVEMEDQVQLLYDANVPDVSTTAFLEVELTRSFTFTGVIRGNEENKELNADNSVVVPGALVEATYTLPDVGSTTISDTTDDDGIFTLTGLPEAIGVTYTVTGAIDRTAYVIDGTTAVTTNLSIDLDGTVTATMVNAQNILNSQAIIEGYQNSTVLNNLTVGADNSYTFIVEEDDDYSEGALLVSTSLETQGEATSTNVYTDVAPSDGIVAPSFTFTMDQSVSFDEDQLYWATSSVRSGGVLIDFDVTLTDTYETDEDGVILTEDADDDDTTAETSIVETADNVITITPKLPLNYGKTYIITFTVENTDEISTTVTKTFTTTSEAEAVLSAPVINRMSSVDFDTNTVILEFLRANFYEDTVSFKVFASIDTDDTDSAAGTDWYEVHDATKTFTDVDFDYETEEDTISIDFSDLETYTGITDLFDTRSDNSGIVNFRIFTYNGDNISSATEFTLEDIRTSVELDDTIGRNVNFDVQNTIDAIVNDTDGNYVSGTNTLNLVSDLYTADTDYYTNDGSDISDEEIIFETSDINFQETVTVVLTDGITDADVNVTWVFTDDTHTTGRVIVTRPDDETNCTFVTTDSITLDVTDEAGNKLSVATDTSDSDDTEVYPASGYVTGTFAYKAFDSSVVLSVPPVVAEIAYSATGDVLAD